MSEDSGSQSIAEPAGILPPTIPQQEWDQVLEGLLQVEHRNWWLWSTAILVMLLLTFPAISFVRAPIEDGKLQFGLSEAVGGLVGLVILFCLYIIYSQRITNRLRRERAMELFRASQLEVHAERLYQMALVDSLTGLYNRRFGEARIHEECRRADRQKTPLTAVMMDLDGFKEINDNHGHPAGDCALKEFARRLKSVSRGSDIAVRLGGDEFLLVLSECDPEQVPHLIDRLREAKVELPTGPIPLRFSAGWAEYHAGESPEDLIERADQALYAAKYSPAKRP